ncbi:hypothetical protein GCM10009630_40130 [Kribbella jejuensis]|uniref:Putative adhesin n=1 Tax=Kribbella jejuensis TaxID=236068 RepID=A0A542ERM6_9ACTN|nr:DUF4097 family beta strand repeat-containing protein [Kribbella jejuensis]TQJ18009.1 putative adhesin [Kribbella jejuensis]
MSLTKAQRTMLLVGLIPLLAVVLGSAAVTVSVIRGKLQYSYSAAFAPAADGVQITSDVSTQVEPSFDGQVHVTVDGTYGAQRPEVNVSTAGKVVVVATRCPDSHCQVDLTVEVPAATAALKAKVDGGSLNVAGVSSPLTVDVSQGSVDMARVRSPQISVSAREGSISLFFDVAPQQVSASSTDGSITVQLPRTTAYSIDAVASQGSTDLSVPNDPTATHRLRLRSSYGSITVQ